MRNIKATIAYDGTDFAGWQVQPDRRTIQGELKAAIERVVGEQVLPQGSGRTDAGVHAQAQVASFAIEAPIPVENLLFALNRTLPPAIRVTHVCEVPADFHARKSAHAKSYRYRISRVPVTSPFVARYVWHYPFPLDEDKMAVAAPLVIGAHDFTAFAAADPECGTEDTERSNVRTIFSSRFYRSRDGESNAEELIYEVRGNGFLHHMVRNLVGTFVLIGKGTLAPSDITRILASLDRSQAGPTAPACGLALLTVEY